MWSYTAIETLARGLEQDAACTTAQTAIASPETKESDTSAQNDSRPRPFHSIRKHYCDIPGLGAIGVAGILTEKIDYCIPELDGSIACGMT